MSPDDTLSTVHAAGMRTRSVDGARSLVGALNRLVGSHPWSSVLAGAAGGVALGVVARLWMRWISVDPEFSWAGTIAIVTAFTVFASAQSATAVARIVSARPGLIAGARVGAGLLSAGLFGAAGALMLPTVLFGSIAVWRPHVRRPIRVLLALPAIPGVVIVLAQIGDDHGWGIESIGRILLFLGIYAAVIAATWPTVAPIEAGWRAPRRLVLVAVLVVVGFIGLALYLGGVQ